MSPVHHTPRLPHNFYPCLCRTASVNQSDCKFAFLPLTFPPFAPRLILFPPLSLLVNFFLSSRLWDDIIPPPLPLPLLPPIIWWAFSAWDEFFLFFETDWKRFSSSLPLLFSSTCWYFVHFQLARVSETHQNFSSDFTWEKIRFMSRGKILFKCKARNFTCSSTISIALALMCARLVSFAPVCLRPLVEFTPSLLLHKECEVTLDIRDVLVNSSHKEPERHNCRRYLPTR